MARKTRDYAKFFFQGKVLKSEIINCKNGTNKTISTILDTDRNREVECVYNSVYSLNVDENVIVKGLFISNKEAKEKQKAPSKNNVPTDDVQHTDAPAPASHSAVPSVGVHHTADVAPASQIFVVEYFTRTTGHIPDFYKNFGAV